MTTTSLADRLVGIARTRDWRWPVASAAVTVVAFTIIVSIRTEVDLGTYLLGGAHAFSSGLYNLRYPITHLPFTYPPFAALLFAPFSHLPFGLNVVGFTWLGLGALFGVIALSLRVTCAHWDRRTVVWWALVLMPPAALLAPIRETFFFGQINLLLALVVVADMTMELRIPKGVLVGLAAAVKLTPIIFVPYLFLTRRPRAGCYALGAFVAAGSIAALASPRASWAYWRHDAWAPNRAGSVAYVGNQGALGVIERLVQHPISSVPSFTVVAVTGALGLAVASVAYRRSSPLLGFVVVEAVECLASPISWDHHFVWVIVLIAWLALAPDRPTHGPAWAAAVAVIFWAAPLWWVPRVRYAGQGWLIPLADCFFLVAVGFVAATAASLIWRHQRRLRGKTTAGTLTA